MAVKGFKRGFTAILSADAVEYSRLMGGTKKPLSVPLLRQGDVDMKLWILTLWILISGGILNGIFKGLAHAGTLYIYETSNPSDTRYAGAGLAGRAGGEGSRH